MVLSNIKTKKYTFLIILDLLIILLIILLNFKLLVFNNNFYEKEFEKNSINNNINKSVLEYNKNVLFNYFKNNDNLDNSFFNEKEKLHLIDVKNLINIAFILLYILLIIFVILTSYLLYKKEYLTILDSFMISGLSLIIFLIIVSLFNFNNLFYNFHLLIFNNDLWLLDPLKDNLIKMFPEYFFYDFFKTLILNILITSIFLIASSFIIRLLIKRSRG
ncbi:MAG: TIGR01906 family membrane protein [archaeon]